MHPGAEHTPCHWKLASELCQYLLGSNNLSHMEAKHSQLCQAYIVILKGMTQSSPGGALLPLHIAPGNTGWGHNTTCWAAKVGRSRLWRHHGVGSGSPPLLANSPQPSNEEVLLMCVFLFSSRHEEKKMKMSV
jgi:hypothetical protein